MDASGSRNFWHQQDVNPATNKANAKLPISTNVNTQFRDVVQYYDANNGNNNNTNTSNNGLKRNYPGSNQRGSIPKKRHYSSQITPPPPSSADHTDDDDEDDDEGESNLSHPNNTSMDKTTNSGRNENQRRAAHTAAEQKRRNAIRKGYDALQSLVPNSHLLDPISSQKVSKAAILKRSTDYLIQLNQEKERLKEQLEAKKNETYCLRAVQKAYEDILEMNINARKSASVSIDDEHKFQVFENIADAIFHSFNEAMQAGPVTNFPQFTSTVLRWVEDSCRPADINEIIRRVIDNFKS